MRVGRMRGVRSVAMAAQRPAGSAAKAALAGIVVAAIVLPLAPGGAGAQRRPRPAVTPAIQVNQDVAPGRAHTEPQMLVHPKNRDILVIVEVEFPSSACVVHISRDGGRTWAPTASRPMPPGYGSCTRVNFGPFIAARFAADGTLFVAAAGARTPTNLGPTDPFVARSSDLGDTWQYSIIKRSEERDFAKPDGTTARDFERFSYVRMAVHPTDPKRVYVGYRRQGAFLPVAQVSERSVVSVSTDGGRTFSQPVDVMERSFPLTEVKGSDAPAMSIAEDGTIYVFTKERPPLVTGGGVTQDPLPQPPPPANLCRPASSAPNAPAWKPTPPTTAPPVAGKPGAGARLLMSRSTDDGKTWTASVVDSSGIVCVPCLTTPETAIDHRTGAIYVVWEQSDRGPPGPRDDRNIWFMRSEDGGRTWTKRVQLNDDSIAERDPNYDQMFPGVGVAPNGRIDVAWYDFRTDALYNPAGNGNTTRRDQTCFDVFYTSSSDGGRTWSENSRVSDRSMNQFEGFAMHPAYDVRGPVGVASLEDRAYVAWQDSRNGRLELPTEDVYMATVLHDTREAGERSSAVRAPGLLLGGGIGLGLAGLALLLGLALSSRARREPPPAADES